jgi:hypothetical protein
VVKLVSAEGFEFIVDYKAACVSNTIRNMLSSQGKPLGAWVHCFIADRALTVPNVDIQGPCIREHVANWQHILGRFHGAGL